MPNYIALVNWTEQGVRRYGNTIDRAATAGELAGKFGVTVTETYWTLGMYDIVHVLDAPDDESATAFALALSSQGNVRTTTMRAFNTSEMRGIIAKVAG